jgi:hypothetical protein
MSGLDVLTFFNSAVAVLVRGREITRMPAHLYEEWSSPTERQIRRDYGVLATYGTKILLNDAWVRLLRIEADILPSDDEALLAFKSACSSEFTMTAVAVSHTTIYLFHILLSISLTIECSNKDRERS